MDSTARLRNIKVGIAAVGAFVLLALSYYMVGALRLSGRTYNIGVVFTDVQGVDQGTPVMVAGVKIGYVHAVSLTESNKALVDLRIRADKRIPAASRVRIASVSLLGDRFVEIIPGQPGRGYLKAGSTLIGTPPFDIDNMFSQVSTVLDRVDKLGASAAGLLNDPVLRQGIQNTIARIEATSTAALALVNDLQSMTTANKDEVNETTRNIADATANLSALLGQFNEVAKGANPADLQEVMANIKVASKRLEEAVSSAATLVGDTTVQDDLKASVRNTREATESAKAVVDRVADLIGARRTGDQTPRPSPTPTPAGTGPKVDMLYDMRHGKSRVDLNYDLQLQSDEFYRFGIYDIGENARVNLQGGKIINPSQAFRFGLYQSRLGLGYDWQTGQGSMLQADLYRPNHLRLDLKGRIDINEETSGWLGVEGIGGKESPVIGIQHRF